jgi:hypothetical protein
MYETLLSSDVKAAQIYWRFRKDLYNLYQAADTLNIYQLEIDTLEKVDSYIDAKIDNAASLNEADNLRSVKKKIDENYKERNRFYIANKAASGK